MTAEKQQATPIARPRQAIELTASECWNLLSSVSLGRVVFTHRAMPAIRPVNHLIDRRTIVIRTHMGAAIAARTQDSHASVKSPGTVVCYEADQLDPDRHTGWSVIVTGLARLVREPSLIERYSGQLEPWIAGDMDHVIAIEPQFVTGLRLVGWCG